MRSRHVGLLLALAWPGTGRAAALTADEVVRHALEHRPSAVSATGDVHVARADRNEASVFLANPQVEVGVAVVGDLVHGSVAQPLSLTGEGWHARRSFGRQLDAAQAAWTRDRLVTAAGARAAYVRAVAASDRAALGAEAIDSAARMRSAQEARAASGEASALDVQLARLGEARVAAGAISARREAAAALATLAAWHPAAAEAELVDGIGGAVPTARGGGTRSDLVAAEAIATARRAELARARAAAVPAIGLGASLELENGETDLGPVITVELPLWGWNQGDIARARAAFATAEAERDALSAIVEAERTATSATAAFAAEAADRLGDVAADARAALGSIERATAAGELRVSEAVVLRGEVLEAWAAGIDAREGAALARLDALLAVGDPSLVPPDVTVKSP